MAPKGNKKKQARLESSNSKDSGAGDGHFRSHSEDTGSSSNIIVDYIGDNDDPEVWYRSMLEYQEAIQKTFLDMVSEAVQAHEANKETALGPEKEEIRPAKNLLDQGKQLIEDCTKKIRQARTLLDSSHHHRLTREIRTLRNTEEDLRMRLDRATERIRQEAQGLHTSPLQPVVHQRDENTTPSPALDPDFPADFGRTRTLTADDFSREPQRTEPSPTAEQIRELIQATQQTSHAGSADEAAQMDVFGTPLQQPPGPRSPARSLAQVTPPPRTARIGQRSRSESPGSFRANNGAVPRTNRGRNEAVEVPAAANPPVVINPAPNNQGQPRGVQQGVPTGPFGFRLEHVPSENGSPHQSPQRGGANANRVQTDRGEGNAHLQPNVDLDPHVGQISNIILGVMREEMNEKLEHLERESRSEIDKLKRALEKAKEGQRKAVEDLRNHQREVESRMDARPHPHNDPAEHRQDFLRDFRRQNAQHQDEASGGTFNAQEDAAQLAREERRRREATANWEQQQSNLRTASGPSEGQQARQGPPAGQQIPINANVPSYPPSTAPTSQPTRQGGHVSRYVPRLSSIPNPSELRQMQAVLSRGPEDDVDEEEYPPNEWYDRLPAPWNRHPRKKKEKTVDIDKMLQLKTLEKFSGKVDEYIPWRNKFIPHIHQSSATLWFKHNALEQSLDKSVPELAEAIPKQSWSPKNYARIIDYLEANYGGAEIQINFHFDRALSMSRVAINSSSDLVTFVNRIQQYIDTLEDLGRGQEAETHYVFRSFYEKLPAPYRAEFHSEMQLEARMLGRPHEIHQSLSKMLDWCHKRAHQIRMDQTNLRRIQSNVQAHSNSRTHYHCQEEEIVDEENPWEDEDTQGFAYDTNRSKFAPNQRPRNVSVPSTAPPPPGGKRRPCPACRESHLLRDCKKFKDMNVQERRRVARDGRVCYNCLSPYHSVAQCPSTISCRHCQRRHNSAMHEPQLHGEYNQAFIAIDEEEGYNVCVEGQEGEDDDLESNFSVQEGQEEPEKQFCVPPDADEAPIISMRIVPVRLVNPKTGHHIVVNALLDDGASRPLLSEEARQMLDLGGTMSAITLTGVGNVSSRYEKSCVASVRVENLDSSTKRLINVRVIPDPVGDLKPVNWNRYKHHWSHLEDITFPEFFTDKVDLILGGRQADLLGSWEERIGGPGEPVGRRGPLGWSVLGSTIRMPGKKYRAMLADQIQNIRESVHSAEEKFLRVEEVRANVYWIGSSAAKTKQEAIDMELVDLVRLQWQIEHLEKDEDDDKALSRDEKYALNKLKRTYKNVDGRLESGCIWRRGEPALPNNFAYALSRLLSLERSKAMLNPTIRDEYNRMIAQMLEKGYMGEVPEQEMRAKVAFYLPMFPVINWDKETTPVRLVADGKAKFNNKSLNDAVLPGPKLINDLVDVLVRFRRRPVAFMGDISEMFMQIVLAPEDRKYHRVLHRDKPDEPIRELEFLRHSFGNAGSPAVAIHAIKTEAEAIRKTNPRLAEAIRESTIVDDHLDSVDTPEEAVALIQDMLDFYKKIGMDVRKFACNKKEVMEQLDTDKWAKGFELVGDNQRMLMPTLKALGVSWDTEPDVLTFTGDLKLPDVITKRTILKTYASFFDPLGFASPVIMVAKSLQQTCWKEKLGWDDPVTDKIKSAWKEWAKRIPDAKEIRIPRSLTKAKPISVQVHVYCDASIKACAAVAYLRTTYADGEVMVRLIMSRSKLGPMNAVTIPRLELMAAVLGTEMVNHLCKSLGLDPVDFYFWTDSANVLAWIKSGSQELLMFVANRVEKIRTRSTPEQWRWTPTHENPADLGSRGMSFADLAISTLWWVGPKYLMHPEDRWPVQTKPVLSEEAKVESKRQKPVLTVTEVQDTRMIKFEQHKNYLTLLGALARARRWLTNRGMPRGTPMTPAEREWAENFIVRSVQREAFAEQIETIQRDGALPKTDHLVLLKPMVDDNGVLRIDSRLKGAAFLDPDVRRPIILPKNHPFTRIVIQYYHGIVLGHVGGTNHTLYRISKKFWIVQGRTAIKKEIRECKYCRIRSCRPISQPEGPLPGSRVPNPTRRIHAFSCAIVDAAGPFVIKQGRNKIKRYLIIFACQQYRAIHIEVVSTLETASFLMALDRFTARRGRPDSIRCDNGTNFRGASNELRQLQACVNNDAISEKFPEINWDFATPLAPHTQGSIERLVGSTKRALAATMADPVLDEETFRTLAIKVEGIINSRPLTYISADPADVIPLTPGHFLLPQAMRELAPIPVTEDLTIRNRWRRMHAVLDHFWGRFVDEYTPHLQSGHRFKDGRVNLEPGDIVAVLEKKDRGQWPLARITEVHRHGIDNKVRVVDIEWVKPRDPDCKKFDLWTATRSVKKLMMLERPDPEEQKKIDQWTAENKRRADEKSQIPPGQNVSDPEAQPQWPKNQISTEPRVPSAQSPNPDSDINKGEAKCGTKIPTRRGRPRKNREPRGQGHDLNGGQGQGQNEDFQTQNEEKSGQIGRKNFTRTTTPGGQGHAQGQGQGQTEGQGQKRGRGRPRKHNTEIKPKQNFSKYKADRQADQAADPNQLTSELVPNVNKTNELEQKQDNALETSDVASQTLEGEVTKRSHDLTKKVLRSGKVFSTSPETGIKAEVTMRLSSVSH